MANLNLKIDIHPEQKYVSEFETKQLGQKYQLVLQVGSKVYTCAWDFGTDEEIKKVVEEQQRTINGCVVEIRK